jgi:alpha-N-arabinofuranosidase
VGDQILKATATDTDLLVSATRDSRSHAIYVKLVNPGDVAAPVRLDLQGAGALASTATAVTLAADSQATNSIDAPDKVVPVASNVTGVSSSFTYTVPARGIVVLTTRSR